MSFRERCEVFDWGDSYGREQKGNCCNRNRKKYGREDNMGNNPYIMAAIFVEGIYYEFNSEFMPQIIHIVEVIILTLVYIQYMAEKIEAIVINEELEKNFTHEIMVNDTCLMVKMEDKVKKLCLMKV